MIRRCNCGEITDSDSLTYKLSTLTQPRLNNFKRFKSDEISILRSSQSERTGTFRVKKFNSRSTNRSSEKPPDPFRNDFRDNFILELRGSNKTRTHSQVQISSEFRLNRLQAREFRIKCRPTINDKIKRQRFNCSALISKR